ncbi:hypothetical protein JZ751_023021 [Albula glossodonta]|uniref:Uncharacterized protein n=1 Tax=Albula glossodonta TaxID=121402 RepID=A0A8T2PHV0_9TELE|nr:hypothetical protein JZ751_023021 [Albula glossodonta]
MTIDRSLRDGFHGTFGTQLTAVLKWGGEMNSWLSERWVGLGTPIPRSPIPQFYQYALLGEIEQVDYTEEYWELSCWAFRSSLFLIPPNPLGLPLNTFHAVKKILRGGGGANGILSTYVVSSARSFQTGWKGEDTLDNTNKKPEVEGGHRTVMK